MKYNFVSNSADEFLSIEQLTSFVPAQFYEGEKPYISFKAYDTLRGRLRPQIIPLEHINQAFVSEYAEALCRRINDQLIRGWSPWNQTMKQGGILIEDVFDEWIEVLEKSFSEGLIRGATLRDYQSKIKNIRLYNAQRESPIRIINEFDRAFVNALLSHIYYERGNTYVTYNNYLRTIHVFVSYCLERGYMEKNPIEGLKTKRKKEKRKHRTIPIPEVQRIFKSIKEEDPHFLLACYMLMYCLIRPTEMSYIRISDISLACQTVYLDASHTKNKTSAYVTIPRFILEWMLELGVFNGPESRYLFSIGMRPGYERITDKTFRDHWAKARKKTGANPEYQFYHLKHTGITLYLKSHCDPLSVRDQARHSSLVITEMYTDHNYEGNPIFKRVSLVENPKA